MNAPRSFRHAFSAATSLLLALTVWGCGVSKSKYTAVESERDKLAVQAKELQTSVDSLNQAKTALEGDLSSLKEKNQSLESEIEAAKQAQQAMQTNYEGVLTNLKGEVASGKIEVQQMRDGLSLNLSQDILFPSGSADLDKGGRELLTKISDDLKTGPYQVVVMGHTDNVPIKGPLARRYATNWELGGARAANIVRLFQNAGVPKERLLAVSLADSRPREDNATPEGRMKNRRIEIRLRPMTADSATNSPN